MRNLVLTLMLMACASSTWAAKANPMPFAVRQSDGSTITVRLHGDERFSWYTTTDNVILVRSGNDFHIANIDSDGNLTSSGQLVHEKSDRSINELTLINSQNQQAFFSEKADRRRAAMRREPLAQATNPAYFPCSGTPTAIVVLVEFQDTKFTVDDPKAVFDQYLNGTEQTEMGYGESLNYGSVRQYFSDMSFGMFQPQFEVVGPITLSEDMAYYGRNSNSLRDVNCDKMVREACQQAAETIDFADDKYDSDADGIIDLVYVIYAGYGECNGADANTIWPKSGTGDYGTYAGKAVKRYGVNNELNANPNVTSGIFATPKINGIGLFCHEFSHCLGLPDFYPYNSAAQIDNQAMEYWSVMDGGEYVYYGYCPTAYTAWERETLGWHTITPLTENANITATPVSDGGSSYKMLNPADDSEYIVIENIQCNGWNSRSLGHGLIAYHVKWPKATVAYNDHPNETPGQPGFALIPADGLLITSYNDNYSTYEYQMHHAGDPFPGTSGVTTLNYAARLPNFTWYTDGPAVNKELKNISENTTTGTVNFDYVHNTTTAIQLPSAVIDNETDKRVYTINGAYVGDEIPTSAKGIFITSGKKIIRK